LQTSKLGRVLTCARRKDQTTEKVKKKNLDAKTLGGKRKVEGKGKN